MTAFGAILSRPLRFLAFLLVTSALLLALVHLDDLFGAHQGPGIWMALARALNAGILYPPLQDHGFYGGSRYTPLFFSLTAALAWIAPDYLVAAKLAALLSVAVLVGGVAAAIRQMTGRWSETPLAALLLAFPQGLGAELIPHGDALAAGLAVWGLVALGPQPTWRRVLGSSLLFVLALLAKFSSLAAPAAAFFFLLLRDRRLTIGLVLSCVLLGLGLLGLTDWLSQGRFLENLRALGGGGSGVDSILQAPLRFFQAIRFSLGFALLLPLLAALLLLRAGRFGWVLWDWYFLTAVVFTLLVYTSRGTADNHLLELEAAGVILLASSFPLPCTQGRGVGGEGALSPLSPVLGGEGSRVRGAFLAEKGDPLTPNPSPPSTGEREERGLERLLQPVLAVAALAALLLGLFPHSGTWRAGEEQGAITKQQVAAAIPPDARLLAEAPAIPVLRGQRPVVQDAFNFGVLARSGKIDDAALAERIGRHEFDVLIMLGRTDRPGETFCPDEHFGPRVTQAILDHYRFERMLGLYALFVPR